MVFAIPTESEWIDCGEILHAGDTGEWDHILWGGFALSAVEWNGVYLLYYQGSQHYDEEGETVAWRAIGLATSSDGIRFTKSPANPVLTWFPRENMEEGAASAAALTDAAGRVVLYYGANTWIGDDHVNADARVATSDDSERFMDLGVVLQHDSQEIWGARDELFPVIAIGEGPRRFVYYIPNGSLQSGTLGVAWGDTSALHRSAPVRGAGRPIPVWGAGGAASVGPGTYAIFLTTGRGSSRTIDVRMVSTHEPDRMSRSVMKYHWPNVSVATVLLDRDKATWFLYYRNASAIGVKVAAMRPDPRKDVANSTIGNSESELPVATC